MRHIRLVIKDGCFYRRKVLDLLLLAVHVCFSQRYIAHIYTLSKKAKFYEKAHRKDECNV